MIGQAPPLPVRRSRASGPGGPTAPPPRAASQPRDLHLRCLRPRRRKAALMRAFQSLPHGSGMQVFSDRNEDPLLARCHAATLAAKPHARASMRP